MKLASLIFLLGALSFFPGCGDDDDNNPLGLQMIPDFSPLLPGSVFPCNASDEEIGPRRLQFAGAKVTWADGEADPPRFLTILEMSITLRHSSLSSGEYEGEIDPEYLDAIFGLTGGNIGTAAETTSSSNCTVGFGSLGVEDAQDGTPFTTIGRIKLVGLSTNENGLDPRSERVEVDVEISYEP